MKKFDLIVIGAGSGLKVASAAAAKGLKTAIIEKGPLGGTCLNRGCIPSKIILHSADVADTIKNSASFGISSRVSKIDFKKITQSASKIVDDDSRQIRRGVLETKNLTFYNAEAKFISEKTLKVGKEIIKAGKIVIAAGTRPSVPNIEGLAGSGFMTSDEALRLTKQPKTLTIMGGGYIGAELAHFFISLGTNVNIIQHDVILISNEDEEISKKFTETFGKRCKLYLNYDAYKVSKKKGKFIVDCKHVNNAGKIVKVVSDNLLIAAGRKPNSDTLDLEKTKVEINKFGYINTDDFLETSCKGIFAFGDIAGKYLFKHSANLEAEYVYNNIILGKKLKVDYSAMPHAMFSSPQVAGVGFREQDLKSKSIPYKKGVFQYIKSGMGIALQDKDGFVKILADPKTKKILGCHIMGTDASTLIHEVILAMKNNLTTDDILKTVHVHPALSEVIQRAVSSIEW